MPDLTSVRCDRCAQQIFSEIEKGKNFTSVFPDHKCYTTPEMTEEFIVHGFMAPFVDVTRKSDNVRGSLEFTHMPRWYFNWRENT